MYLDDSYAGVLVLECIWGWSITMETVGAMMCVYLDDWCASIGVHMGMVLQRSPWEVSTRKHQCSVSNTAVSFELNKTGYIG